MKIILFSIFQSLPCYAVSFVYANFLDFAFVSYQSPIPCFEELATKFEMAGKAEANHAKILADYLESLQNGTKFSNARDVDWLCSACGYIHHGKSAPERCPLCNHSREYYVKN